MPFDQHPEGLLPVFTHLGHQGKVIGVWLDRSGHDTA